MNTNPQYGHLTEKELSRWMVEGPSVEAKAHVEGCWSCQAKLAEAEEPLKLFRTAVVAWSEAQPTPALRPAAAESGARNWRLMGWLPAASLATAVLLLAAFLVGNGMFRRPVVRPGLAQVSDSVLMSQVDEEVSEAVPDAMAPLTDLVAWDSSEGAASAPKVVKKKAGGSKSHLHVAN
jgi:hypothetical protein